MFEMHFRIQEQGVFIMLKRFFSIILIIALSVTPASLVSANSPSPKEEVVYGLLNLDGSVDHLYVVNSFEGGTITDYGDYSDIRNMTTSEKINKDGDKITINTKADKFYYQGTLKSKELPWDITIKYFLNDKKMPGADLGGKSGKLKIRISVKQNDKMSSFFFDHYALQIVLSLDSRLCSNIEADQATIAEAGNKKQLTFFVLPGKDADIVVTADVCDFEMDPILLNGIRLTMNINIDSSEFTEQFSELKNAIEKLDDGASELLDGMNQLSEGMQKYISGIKAFKGGLGQLSDGAEQLHAGAALLKNGLSQLTKQNDSLLGGAMVIQQAAFAAVNMQLGNMGLNIPALTPENYNAVLSAMPQLAAVKSQLDGILQFTEGLQSYLNGVSQLDSGASDLLAGISEFKSSSAEIAASANELYNGGAEIHDGIKKLRDGLASYKKGTKELRNGTSGIDSEIEQKIQEMLDGITGKDAKTVSFVSDKNTHVSSVQFVLKTGSISAPEVQKAPRPEPAKLNFWQRLLKLFGLYNE